jgi:Tol biopolymer transport system component
MPAWSPQGDWIAFVSDEAGTSDIWLIPAGGGERRRLTTDKPQAFAPSWTADGSALVFTSGCQETATVWMATDLPSPTVAVERKAWGQLKQLFR